MRVDWYGQSAFRLTAGDQTVFIDPFGDMSSAASRGMQWDYPAIEGVSADLLLVTHEHLDHNGVEAIGGDPAILRSTAGTHESPIGEVIGVASEHDEVAGTQRGPNTIFVFSFDGIRVAHFGDFGQSALRPEQRDAIENVDLLLVPVGGGLRSARMAPTSSYTRSRPAGSCRCTTGRSASASSIRPTSSSSATTTSSGSPSPASTARTCAPPTAR